MESRLPDKHYGIIHQNRVDSVGDEAVEEIHNVGYTIVESNLSTADIEQLSRDFEDVRARYKVLYGEERLRNIDEHNTIRSPMIYGKESLVKLALDENLHAVLRKVFCDRKYIINQQNGVINPPQKGYNQGAWHRDLPYQHFVSNVPLAVNALFCLDDFTLENGSTFVIPATHKIEPFPSENYVKNHAVQVEAKAGSFILLDCMTFHSGGYNSTDADRRAINHVFNIPYFKQQVNIPRNLPDYPLSDRDRDILGFNDMEYTSVETFLERLDKRVEGC